MNIDLHPVAKLEHLNSYGIAEPFLLLGVQPDINSSQHSIEFFVPLLLHTALFGLRR